MYSRIAYDISLIELRLIQRTRLVYWTNPCPFSYYVHHVMSIQLLCTPRHVHSVIMYTTSCPFSYYVHHVMSIQLLCTPRHVHSVIYVHHVMSIQLLCTPCHVHDKNTFFNLAIFVLGSYLGENINYLGDKYCNMFS